MPILSLILAAPLAGAAIILVIPGRMTKTIQGAALAAGSMALVLCGFVWRGFDPAASGMQFAEKMNWIPAFGISYHLGIDGISIVMTALTALLTLVSLIYSLNITERTKEFFFWFLILETGMLGVFMALDFFLFYVFWEITLVPAYFLIGIWGGRQKEYAAMKFFIHMIFASVFMLLAMLALYFNSTPHTFDLLELAKQNAAFTLKFQLWVFAALYLAFAVKIPAFPFHTWFPSAHTQAPAGVSVMLAGVLLKIGLYGLLRISFPILPAAAKLFLPFLVIIAVINILYGALAAMAQKDIKRMTAYFSISQTGCCMLGIAAMSAEGFNGALLLMAAHGVIIGSLLLLTGVIEDRSQMRGIEDFGGLGARLPVYTGFMILQSMAAFGVPGLAGFAGQFLCFMGAFSAWPYYAAAGIAGTIITAAFFLKMIEKIFLGELNPRWAQMKDMNAREIISIAPLAALTLLLGIWPNVCLNVINPAVSALAETLK